MLDYNVICHICTIFLNVLETALGIKNGLQILTVTCHLWGFFLFFFHNGRQDCKKETVLSNETFKEQFKLPWICNKATNISILSQFSFHGKNA